MKHTSLITAILVCLFIISQLVGLYLISREAQVSSTETGITVHYEDTAIGPRPETTGGGSLLYVVVGIGVGTGLVLLLVKYMKFGLWRLWFFLAVWLSITISLGVLIKMRIFFDYDIAMLIALAAAAMKLRWQNPWVHNATEMLMYAGIALILVPLFELKWAILLLVIISLYDMYAVWKSKHMVAMARFQERSKLFAGLFVRYVPSSPSPSSSPIPSSIPLPSYPSSRAKAQRKAKIDLTASKSASKKLPPLPPVGMKSAVLGGGDMAFPLIFTGVVFQTLLLAGLPKIAALGYAGIVTLFSAAALTGLFVFAKKDRYYPAMPFISAGCLLGLGVVWLLALA